MDHTAVIALLYLAGVLLLVAEIFVPSGGLLTVGALICMGVAVFNTFARDTTAGIIGSVACVVTIPTVFILGLKYLHRLPFGDRLAPPNPSLTEKDRSFDAGEYSSFIGVSGVAVTHLRPIGVCEFNGRRVQCRAESGMIDAGTGVVGIGMKLNNLEVRADGGGPVAAESASV